VIPEHRRTRILELLTARQQTSVNDLADDLGVSRETVRRDLGLLEEDGLLRKVHGGAVPVQTGAEPVVKLSAGQQRLEKLAIGERAAALFTAGDSLFVDAGTTTAAFGAALARVEGLTVITNSLDVAGRVGTGPGENKVFVLGGDFRAEALETVGPVTIEQIEGFRADHAVLTVGAIDAAGMVCDFNLEEAAVARAMIRQARDLTILADHTKFARSALVKICTLREVRRVVTDSLPGERLRQLMQDAGIELIVAGGYGPSPLPQRRRRGHPSNER